MALGVTAPAGTELAATTPVERPKPPSYVMIRNQLTREFGEDVYKRCKRRVQNHMEYLSETWVALYFILLFMRLLS